MTPELLRELCVLTEQLVKLRQANCAHLCVENIGPEILAKLIEASNVTAAAVAAERERCAMLCKRGKQRIEGVDTDFCYGYNAACDEMDIAIRAG